MAQTCLIWTSFLSNCQLSIMPFLMILRVSVEWCSYLPTICSSKLSISFHMESFLFSIAISSIYGGQNLCFLCKALYCLEQVTGKVLYTAAQVHGFLSLRLLKYESLYGCVTFILLLKLHDKIAYSFYSDFRPKVPAMHEF